MTFFSHIFSKTAKVQIKEGLGGGGFVWLCSIKCRDVSHFLLNITWTGLFIHNVWAWSKSGTCERTSLPPSSCCPPFCTTAQTSRGECVYVNVSLTILGRFIRWHRVSDESPAGNKATEKVSEWSCCRHCGNLYTALNNRIVSVLNLTDILNLLLFFLF